ncbi:MAG: NAD-dependent epimerase/dehydratase family protein [Candidatus Omnitrophica bacterium]|nr:NAD-dependent epimerase/dehydratase family protein [Candidatus Omnitrophota bacterium]
MSQKLKTKSKKPKIQGKIKTAKNSKGNESKLISIRIPENVISKLREVAGKKGDGGYQHLIKTYIAKGLVKEDELSGNLISQDTGAKEPVPAKKKVKPILKETLKKIGTPVPKTGKNDRSNVAQLTQSDVIAEDIRQLAKALEPYYSFFAGKTFLITGAFGFLGRYIVNLLKYLNDEVLEEKTNALLLDNFVTGYEQRVIHDKHLRFHRHNVIEPFQTDEDVDYIIHAAGIASPAYYTKFPIETMDVGTIGTRNMLELAYEKNVKSFLFTSSSEVYGDPDPKFVPTPEDYYGNVSITGPRSCYDESKRFGETMTLAYWRTYGVPVKNVRPFNVYGPGIRPDDFRVLPNFIEHALRKEPIPIHGEGRNTRSFCYINDAIEAIFRILFSNHNGEAFNVGNPSNEISVKDLALMVAQSMPYKIDVVHIDPPHAVYASSDPKRRCPDISKLKKLTGYKPRYSLQEGISRTIQWFCEF